MALLVKQGMIASPSTVSNQTIEVGFEPKAIIFHGAGFSGSGDWSNAKNSDISYGFATSPTEQCVTQTSIGTSGTAANATNTTHCVYMGNSVLNYKRASLYSISSTGFTLNWDTIGSQPYAMDVSYTAIGGDDVLGAKAFNAGMKSGTGGYTVSGVGFEPNMVLMSTGGNRTTQGAMVNIGAATTSGQWTQSGGSASTTNFGARSWFLTNHLVYVQISDTSVYGKGSFSGFNADGWSMNFTQSMLTDFQMNALALRLATPPKSGIFTQNTTTGASSYTGLGGMPKGMLFESRGEAAYPGYTNDLVFNRGTTDGVSAYSSTVGRGNAPYGWGRQFTGDTPMIMKATNTSSPAPILASANTSFEEDGFTTTWSSSDGVAREIFYVALLETVPLGNVYNETVNIASTSSTTLSAAASKQDAWSFDTASALSTIAHAATRETQVGIQSQSDLAYVVRRLVTRDFSIDTDSAINLDVERMRQTGYETSSLSGVAISSQRLRTTLYQSDSTITVYISTAGFADNTYVLSATSDLAYIGNMDAQAFFEIDMGLSSSLSQSAIRDTEYETALQSIVTQSGIRIREEALNVVLLSDTEYEALKKASGTYVVSADSHILLLPSARLSGEFVTIIDTDINIKAKPRLVRTYEDVFGRTAHTQGQVVSAQNIGITRRHIKGKSR